MRGKQIILATLSGLLALGAGATLSTNHVKAAAKTSIVNITFKPTSESNLTNYVYDTVDPTSQQFHQYLTPSEFAAKFGQSDSYIQSFKDYLNKYHVRTYVYPGNLSLKLSGTSANLQKAFKAKHVPAKKGFRATTSYKLPESLSDQVVAVIGLYSEKPAKKTAKKTVKKITTHKKAAVTNAATDSSVSNPKPNTNLSANAFSKKYGAAKFANAYQLTSLYDKGLQGQDSASESLTPTTCGIQT